MTLPSHPFQVNLHAVVELLSTHIYSNPRVFLRELIQNARDAIMTRIEAGTLTLDDALIQVTPVGPESGELVVTDNGAGMHREEMAELLFRLSSHGPAWAVRHRAAELLHGE